MLNEALYNPLAIVGDEDLVKGFKALGFGIYSPKNSEELIQILAYLVKEKIAVCLVQDSLYHSHQDKINAYRNLAFPIFLPFSKSVDTDLLNEMVKEIKVRATGVD
jgi:vacuolar-type H+-ATPase subunit F/Vma7